MKNKQTIWIIVLGLLVVGLTSYIITDKFILQNVEPNNNQENNENNQEENITVTSSYTKTASKKVTDRLDHPDTHTHTLTLDIPMINSTKPGTLTLNQKIQTDFQDEKEIIENVRDIDWQNQPDEWKNQLDDIVNQNSTIFDITYEYNISNDVIWILISKNGYFLRGSAFEYRYAYYYDIKNDKELTQAEIASKFNIDLEVAKTQMKQACTSTDGQPQYSHDALENNLFTITLKENNFVIYYGCLDGLSQITYQK